MNWNDLTEWAESRGISLPVAQALFEIATLSPGVTEATIQAEMARLAESPTPHTYRAVARILRESDGEGNYAWGELIIHIQEAEAPFDCERISKPPTPPTRKEN